MAFKSENTKNIQNNPSSEKTGVFEKNLKKIFALSLKSNQSPVSMASNLPQLDTVTSQGRKKKSINPLKFYNEKRIASIVS